MKQGHVHSRTGSLDASTAPNGTAGKSSKAQLQQLSGAGQLSQLYPKEWHKTAVALVLMVASFLLTNSSLAVVHEYVPDYGPLPDVALSYLPHFAAPWAIYVTEITMQIHIPLTIAIMVFHKHRSIVIRRVALTMALLYAYRSVTMFVTVLPKPNPDYYCTPKLANKTDLTLGLVMGRSLSILVGGGLVTKGHHVYCGDFIYSGHTLTLVMTSLIANEYLPPRFWPMKWLYILSSSVGICFILMSNIGHYTVDVIIAYWITTRVWYMIHAMAYNSSLRESSNQNVFSRLWWWRLFDWFECNVNPGLLSHGFDWPIHDALKARLTRLARFKTQTTLSHQSLPPQIQPSKSMSVQILIDDHANKHH